MLTLDDFFQGRDKDPRYGSLLTHELIGNAQVTIQRVNLVITHYYSRNLSADAIKVASGWRPPAVNAAIKGAARKSLHMTCEALDARDQKHRPFARFCWEEKEPGGLLERIGLWLEHPGATADADDERQEPWVHLQIVPPRSGLRCFIPSEEWAGRLRASGLLEDPFKEMHQ